MPTLSITKTYDDGQVLNESDLDNIKNSLETFINSTKLDGDNIQLSAIADDLAAEITATGANAIADAITSTGADLIAQSLTSTGINSIFDSRARSTGTTVSAGGVAISSSSGAYTQTSSSYTDITNLSVTITTSGRPVWIQLVPDSAAPTVSQIDIYDDDGASSGASSRIKILRDATTVGIVGLNQGATNANSSLVELIIPPGVVAALDSPAAGTYTYKVQGSNLSGADGLLSVTYCKLCVYEL